MKTTETKKAVIFESEDENGEFGIKILKSSCPQIQITTHGPDWQQETYFNVDGIELIAIRDMLNTVIKSQGWEPMP